jgi:hypothetical protein
MGQQHRSNGRGGIALPGQLEIQATFQPGPHATPAVITFPSNGKINLMVVGGLTKVESLAGTIAAGMVRTPQPESGVLECLQEAGNFPGPDELNRAIAGRSVDIAEAILAECEFRNVVRQQAAAEAAAAAKAEPKPKHHHGVIS